MPLAASALTPFSRFTGLEMAELEPLRERPVRRDEKSKGALRRNLAPKKATP